MAFQCPNLLFLVYIPDLNLPRLGADAQMVSLIRPAEGGDLVEIAEIAELRYGQRGGVPDVDG